MNRITVITGFTLLALFAASCAQVDVADLDVNESTLSAAARLARATAIRDAARARGIRDGALMVALLAEEETYMSHCASEFRACPGPSSPDCGGGAVLSGGGDGPCSIDQGGLGMFQIDDGTEAQTVRAHGERVLTFAGNTDVAIDRILQKLVVSNYVGISNTAEAIAFLNALRIDDPNWDSYVRTLVRYWNGCREGASCWSNRYTKYDRAGRTLLSEMGRDFWYGTTTPPPTGTGWLASPIDAPRVTSYVSHARSGGGWERYDCTTLTRSNHRGTDFGVAVGTEVRAAAAGTVIRSTTGCPNTGSMSSTCGGSFGNHVIVLHDGGFATLYAHFSPDGTQIRNGARVECGGVLGHSGNSGRSSGPHLHFEVRSGVRDVSTYYVANNTLDPFGGRCSSQTESLWIGGSPMVSCTAASRDDAVVVRSTYPEEAVGTPGGMITQVLVWRNRGTTTWTPANYVMRHESGAFSEVAEVMLPAGVSVAPGQDIQLRVTVMVPTAAGRHRGTWRMTRRDGAAFGSEAYLVVRVAAAPGACRSETLGREVPSGDCVQVSYPGCSLSRCAWYRCADGAWQCSETSECTAESFPNAVCSMASDGGVERDAGTDAAAPTCASLGCGDCTQMPGCAYCPGSGTCLAMADAASCTGGTTTSPGACDVCHDLRATCVDRFECCEATTNDNIQCIQGFCEDVTMCEANGRTCVDGDPASRCCGIALCGRDTTGAYECCSTPGVVCTTSAECCGYEQCEGGLCQAQQIGEPCRNTQECDGASYCLDNNTCGF